MTDIVERLRGLAPVTNAETRATIKEAAAEIERLRAALERISLGSQNSMTSKEALGKEARAALEGK